MQLTSLELASHLLNGNVRHLRARGGAEDRRRGRDAARRPLRSLRGLQHSDGIRALSVRTQVSIKHLV